MKGKKNWPESYDREKLSAPRTLLLPTALPGCFHLRCCFSSKRNKKDQRKRTKWKWMRQRETEFTYTWVLRGTELRSLGLERAEEELTWGVERMRRASGMRMRNEHVRSSSSVSVPGHDTLHHDFRSHTWDCFAFTICVGDRETIVQCERKRTMFNWWDLKLNWMKETEEEKDFFYWFLFGLCSVGSASVCVPGFPFPCWNIIINWKNKHFYASNGPFVSRRTGPLMYARVAPRL